VAASQEGQREGGLSDGKDEQAVYTAYTLDKAKVSHNETPKMQRRSPAIKNRCAGVSISAGVIFHKAGEQ
jgi:hypothetical protein